MKKDSFVISRSKRLESAVSEVIPINYNRQGAFACIQNISVTDETNSPTRVDIGFLRGNNFIPIKSFTTPLAGFTVIHDNATWLHIDDMPACRILGGVVDDNVQITITGYILYEINED